MKTFSGSLVEWWGKNCRAFPWRFEKNLYRILIAETFLHRTRAEAVVQFYLKFLNEFPDIKSLAKSDLRNVLAITRTLGLMQRWNFLKQAARTIEREYSGIVPLDRKKLVRLPGIGDYIASAIRVFGAGYGDPLIDGNTVRVVCRVNGCSIKDSTRRGKKVRTLYLTLMDKSDPSKFGYSMIDLGAKICIPHKPLCRECPVLHFCKTGNANFDAD